MGRVRDILERFRPAGAPGSATIAGVPADRVRELAAELQPVLLRLDEAAAECAQIIRVATAAAADRREDGSVRSRQLVEDARLQAAAVRAEAAAGANTQVVAEEQAAVVAARAQADRIGRLAARRLPSFVARVTEAIRDIGRDTDARAAAMKARPR